MADETGGVYFRATDSGELEDAYESISALERQRVGDEIFLTTQELAPWLLMIVTLLIVSGGLTERLLAYMPRGVQHRLRAFLRSDPPKALGTRFEME